MTTTATTRSKIAEVGDQEAVSSSCTVMNHHLPGPSVDVGPLRVQQFDLHQPAVERRATGTASVVRPETRSTADAFSSTTRTARWSSRLQGQVAHQFSVATRSLTVPVLPTYHCGSHHQLHRRLPARISPGNLWLYVTFVPILRPLQRRCL